MAPFSPFRGYHPRGKNCGGTPKKQVVNKLPLFAALGLGPPRAQEGRGYKLSCFYAGKVMSMKSLMQLEVVGARSSRAAPGRSDPLLR
jgi:hypothetical protein